MCTKDELVKGIAEDTKHAVKSVGHGISVGAYHQAKRTIQSSGEAGIGIAYAEDAARLIGGMALDVSRFTATRAAKMAVVYQQEHSLNGPRLDSRAIIEHHENLRQRLNSTVRTGEALPSSAIENIRDVSPALQQEQIDYLRKNVATTSGFKRELDELSLSNYEAARIFRSMDDVKFVNDRTDDYITKNILNKHCSGDVRKYKKSSKQMQIIQLKRLLKEGGLSPTDIKYINDAINAKNILKHKSVVPLRKKFLKRYYRSVKGRLMKFLKQDEAGMGALMAVQAAALAIMITKKSYRNVRKVISTTKNASLLAYKAAASTKLAKRIGSLKKVRALRTGVKSAISTAQARVSASHIPTMRAHRKSMFRRMKSFRQDPFGVKRRAAALRKKAFRGAFRLAAKPFKLLGRRFAPIGRFNKRTRKIVEFINRIMMKLVQGAMAIVSFLAGLLFAVLGWAMFGALAVFTVVAIVANIFSLFSLDDYHFDNAKEAVYETVQECYQEQMQQILPDGDEPFKVVQVDEINEYEGVYRQLQNVDFTFKANRDDSLYEQYDHKPERGFIETTNTAELLSMAQIVYDFNLEKADLDELKEWTKGMYYGSHTVEVIPKNNVTNKKYKPVEEKYTVEIITNAWMDEDGRHFETKTETRTRMHYSTLTTYDEDIIVTTTYFPGLFSCTAGSLDEMNWMSVQGLSTKVLSYKPLLQKYCNKYGIPDKVNVLMAIMQEESGGRGGDPMQASESKTGSIGSITDPEESIKQGCKYWASLFKNNANMDMRSIIQSYNFGGGFLDYVRHHGGKYTFKNACDYAKLMNAKKGWDPQIVTYRNNISVPINGGWRYNYGNMFYVKLIERHLSHPTSKQNDVKCDTVKAQKIVDAAFSQLGVPYVWGGTSPGVGLDCSGFVQYCYSQAGIPIGRTTWTQGSGGKTVSSPKPGDIVYYGSHVGIYIGNGKMVHSPQPGDVVKIGGVNYKTHTYIRY